jgi:hypothetical protein
MADVLDYFRAQARILHRTVKTGDRVAIHRVRTIDELCGLDDDALTQRIRRRHCLATVAREAGFDGWPHLVDVIGGATSGDFGTSLYPAGADAHWNIWSASYNEAREIRRQHGGYLLAYRRHFFIVDRYFVETLRLDPDDPDWELMGRDWVRPRLAAARERMYEKLVRLRLPQRAS